MCHTGNSWFSKTSLWLFLFKKSCNARIRPNEMNSFEEKVAQTVHGSSIDKQLYCLSRSPEDIPRNNIKSARNFSCSFWRSPLLSFGIRNQPSYTQFIYTRKKQLSPVNRIFSSLLLNALVRNIHLKNWKLVVAENIACGFQNPLYENWRDIIFMNLYPGKSIS